MSKQKQNLSVDHPLEQLTAEEIEAATDILEAESDLGDGVQYHNVTLDEPPKSFVREFEPGDSFDRKLEIVAREDRETYEATVSVTDGELLSCEHVPGVEPAVMPEEIEAAREAVKSDPEWREAAKKRGVEDFDLVMVDPWSASGFEPEAHDDKRLCRAISWVRTSPNDNGRARPIEGLFAFVDLDEMEVVEIEDNGVPDPENPLPPEDADYRADRVETRDDFEHLDVIQPDGPSWEVEGNKVEWLDWEMRIGWNAREGLVFHGVTFDDDGESRRILHRASASEMAVPYGDPDPNHSWKNAFDIGEYHVGRMANELTEGCDCLGVMKYFDVEMSTMDGGSRTLESAICMHEEDDGVLWKHTDERKPHTEVRRRRRLVISFIATVYNYDYGFYWYFYPDGSIEAEVRLTGVDSNGVVPVEETADDTHGQYAIVAPGVKAPIHQHFFNFRLDFDIDGGPMRAQEVHNEQTGSERNRKNGFRAKETLLERESDARQDIDPLRGRYWRIESSETENSYGRSCGYKLDPHDNVSAPMKPTSSVMERSGFVQNHFWATPYDDDEKFAAGDYPNLNDHTTGLPEWTEEDRSIVDEDLVVWYTQGVNHVPSPEDWPILSAEIASFSLEPEGFFDGNKSITLPPEPCHTDYEITSPSDD